MAACNIFHSPPFEICAAAAGSVELIHAASLLLDDLPSMDDAKTRRGKPCTHRVFPKWTVDMLPLFLMNTAYHLLLNNRFASCEQNVAVLRETQQACQDMFEGQELDLTLDGNVPERVLNCLHLKTASLFSAATKSGALLCGADTADVATLEECGVFLGLAYQVWDDLADKVVLQEAQSKDRNRNTMTNTAVNVWGLEGATNQAAQFKEQAIQRLDRFGAEADTLRGLIRCMDPSYGM